MYITNTTLKTFSIYLQEVLHLSYSKSAGIRYKLDNEQAMQRPPFLFRGMIWLQGTLC